MPSNVVNQYSYFPETEILRIAYQSGAVDDDLKLPLAVSEDSGRQDQKEGFLLL